jgi:hypothetical protein
MHMKTRICLGSIGLVLAACEPGKEPVEKLSFEQLQKVVETCKSTGKIATDNYCKEAVAVYGPQDRARREKARIAKELAEPGVPFVGYSKK